MTPPLSTYIGLPFQAHGRDRTAIDCYGLLRLYYLEQFGIELPSYGEDYAGAGRADAAEMGQAIERHMPEWLPASEPAVGDAILLKLWGQPCHVGIVIAPQRSLFLHAIEGSNSCLERWRDMLWERKVAGFYRHPGRA
jgi:cell wall-associated NlpC family hydrolase